METPTTEWTLPLIDLQRCTGCGLCVQLCPTNAVEIQNGHAVITHPEACSFCEVCETYCPPGAINRPFMIIFASSSQSSNVQEG
jgi:ferredoxin